VQGAARRSGRRYLAVRFGNVLGSRGSVVPYFQAQIARGGPVTVTDPEVRRYFMTIPEAVQLVLQAAALGEGGEVFILDMGEPVKIVDLAVDLIRLTGLRPRVCWPGPGSAGRRPGKAVPSNGRGREWDVEVVFTGLRPGEKLFEELIVDGEEAVPTCHQKILVSRNGHDELPCPVHLEAAVEALAALARAGDERALRAKLREIVPRYRPAGEDAAGLPLTAWQRELVPSSD
jgi:FlaA1/EpsC-like NDP-sugar epimerase